MGIHLRRLDGVDSEKRRIESTNIFFQVMTASEVDLSTFIRKTQDKSYSTTLTESCL
jgi:hypothetical protein